MSDERTLPTRAEVHGWLRDRSNWGRWGIDDEAGTTNLITPEKRLAAFGLVRSGRAISLARPYPKQPSPANPEPAQHFIRRNVRDHGGGSVVDYYGFIYHGHNHTHLDALSHVWDSNGAWQGRDPNDFISTGGVSFADVTVWEHGIITRGVLIDIPRHRGEPYVTPDRPVHGWELAEAAEAQGVTVEPGDALVVYSGREAYFAANPDATPVNLDLPTPGLHSSCIEYLRDTDVAVLVWDMMDARPNDYDLPWSVHGVIHAFGLALIDNALLEPLAEACAAEERNEFLLIVSPLVVPGGTGSPVNPLAVF